MNKTIYEEALLDLRMSDSMRVAGQHVLTREQYSTVFKALEQAKKQEQEHIEYSKKVQEHFSNDTKRIGELESKLIKQEKLLWLYIEYIKELENMNSIYNAEICEHSKHHHIKDGMLDQHNDKINEILKKIRELKNNGK